MTRAISTVLIVVLYALAFYGAMALAIGDPRAFMAPKPTPPTEQTHYIVIERDVLRCEMGATLQASADADGNLIVWCLR